ncbi:MAG TPA: DNA integrity scanning diadenylate cyclase DisA [Dictyoglomaceae bacterium]|nr:DNA integrity scanning diadenylate cyclase DisA [Dictyoglomaceae bacterium]HOL39120.1 DNA integrity scanning diadenylate cyclase DisA [Dictyoglomaceae bacterium]HOP94271.1 DNA integrity scanning diadenylate cyclase DisA [Dictyoglomaceae bacterium]HPP15274.1 DNA integrity scanning diadenylate cyclase DisA [Dictyoglomaceae bacterium]HPU42680.1 DNA integrity scanning diadenylate cyclase DisA [Dictyoglomaceae bacterium]
MADLKKFTVQALKVVAPGTLLRESLEQIVKAKTGALIVICDIDKLKPIMNGGFPLDIEFTPNRLYELSKMDGAMILSKDCKRILFANVILLPDPNIQSMETGARHATAERVAKQIGCLVISVSQRKDTITLFQNDWKYVLRDVEEILTKASQALQTMERYRNIYDNLLQRLNSLELENQVNLYEVLLFLHRAYMLFTIGKEVENYLIELGTEGRLIETQLEALLTGVKDETILVIKDYARGEANNEEIFKRLIDNFKGNFQEFSSIAGEILGYKKEDVELNIVVTPRGYRILSKMTSVPASVVENIVKYFGNLPKILESSFEDLDNIEGIGGVRAKKIREGLTRLQRLSGAF